MGLFSKKKKTTTEVVNKKVTLSKIVKFTYLQTLAVDGSLSTAGEIGGETDARTSTEESGATRLGDLSKVLSGDSGKAIDIAAVLFGGTLPGFSKVTNALFGKKVSVDTKIDVKESGWTLIKTWNQPQFDIIKYAIGIKDLTIAQFTYEETSEVISKPWRSPKEVIKVLITADQYIPSIFPTGNYIKYYVRPNIEDSDWIQINPLGQTSVFNEDGSIVPRIINFNTEQPISSRLEESYITTSSPVKEVIFRAVMSRPSSLEDTTASADGYSPVLKSYRLLMTPRNGL